MILETERLILREFSLLDAESLFALNTNPNVLQYSGDAPFTSVAASELFICNYSSYADYGYGRWSVVLKSSNEFIGWCGIKFHPSLNYTDLGFRFFEKHWNQGYATESGRAVINYSFTQLNLKELVARVENENLASVRVLQKLGFHPVQEIEFNGRLGKLLALTNPGYSSN